MIEHGLYYLKKEFINLVKAVGGTWNDTKRRPIVCLIKSSKNPNIYWAIPMGNFKHRTVNQQNRILKYMSYSANDIRSCYYHIGRTTNKSIFFISDAIPIIDKYIEDVHLGPNKKHYIIKNKKLLKELERKLFRLLSIENSKPNYYRQHITCIYKELEKEI